MSRRKPKTREMRLVDAIAAWQEIPPSLRAVVYIKMADGQFELEKTARDSRTRVIPDFLAHAERMELAASAYEAAIAILQIATAYRLDPDDDEVPK